METRKEVGKNLNRKRISQLAFMFSKIAKISEEEAKVIILCTDVGTGILEGNETILYEQQTENLAEIVEELKLYHEYQEIASLFTIENIVNTAKLLWDYEKEQKKEFGKDKYLMKSNKELKYKINKELIKKRKNVLKIKEQNLLNARRVENVN